MYNIEIQKPKAKVVAQDPRFRSIGSLIVKVTNRCNLDCAYCYEKVSKTGQDMDIEVFKKLISTTLFSTRKRSVLVIFHGGEPSLINYEWYKDATSYAKMLAHQNGKKIAFGLQSNLLALNNSKFIELRKLGINFSVSLDGPPEILGGTLRGQDDRTIRKFQDVQKIDRRVGVLFTINKINYDKFPAILKWLDEETETSQFKANVVYSVGAGKRLTPMKAEEIFMAQKTIVDYMIENPQSKLVENNLSADIIRFFESQNSSQTNTLCDEKICGAGKSVFGVNQKGELFPCGRFEHDEYEYRLGDIERNEFDAKELKIFKQEISQFHERNPENWYNCLKCEARFMCNFSCQAFIDRSINKANIECEPTKLRYAYFKSRRNALLPLYHKFKNTK